jgi:hypothetical protein
VAYDKQLENKLGAPYILISHIEGLNASSMWNPDRGVVALDV